MNAKVYILAASINIGCSRFFDLINIYYLARLLYLCHKAKVLIVNDSIICLG